MSDSKRNHDFDAYRPSEMARSVFDVGVVKSKLAVSHTLALAILAGGFIAMGAAFATLAMTRTDLGFGPTRLLGGVTFSLGLILVVVAGAELFTGNNLVAMAWASRAISTKRLLRNWALVYAGNFVGAAGVAVLFYWSGAWQEAQNAVGLTAIRMAAAKTDLSFGECFFRGILCNALVCLAVWLCHSCRSTVDKIFAVVWPIAAFVALGFEHCVANMYVIPLGLMLKADGDFIWYAQSHGIAGQNLTIGGLFGNLVPVTLGNIIGGTLLVAGIYWFVYLRNTDADTKAAAPAEQKSAPAGDGEAE